MFLAPRPQRLIQFSNLGYIPTRVLRLVRTFDDIEIRDISLEDYIAVKGKYATYLPHTAGRYQKKRFRKATVSTTVVVPAPARLFFFLWILLAS